MLDHGVNHGEGDLDIYVEGKGGFVDSLLIICSSGYGRTILVGNTTAQSDVRVSVLAVPTSSCGGSTHNHISF